MANFIQIHPENPQKRLIRHAVDVIQNDGLIVYPTDSSYALGCKLDSKGALERILRLRNLKEDHFFSLVCKDFSQVALFAKLGNEAFRMMKSLTPGPFTFILQATREVPRRLLHPKRKSVGIRLPDSPIAQALVEELGEPIYTSTLIMPGDEVALSDPYDILDRLGNEVDAIIDVGDLVYAPTTIIGLTDDVPEIIRQGKGIVSHH